MQSREDNDGFSYSNDSGDSYNQESDESNEDMENEDQNIEIDKNRNKILKQKKFFMINTVKFKKSKRKQKLFKRFLLIREMIKKLMILKLLQTDMVRKKKIFQR